MSVGRQGIIAVLLLIVGVLFGSLYRVADGVEHHSYNSGAVPAHFYRVTAGKQYEIATRTGPGAVPDGSLQCRWNTGEQQPQPLSITAVDADSRLEHVIATFIAPADGQVHIECDSITGVFVDDADNVGADYALLYLVVCVVAFVGAVAVGLSVLYRRYGIPLAERPAAPAAGRHVA